MSSAQVNLSKEDRIFQIGLDTSLIYVGKLAGEPRPFVRIGPAPLNGVELNTVIGHHIISAIEPGNLARERTLDGKLNSILEHPETVVTPEQVQVQHVAEGKVLRRVFNLLELTRKQTLHKGQKYEAFDEGDGIERHIPDVESQHLSDGNFRVNLAGRNLYDFERSTKRIWNTNRIWESLVKACERARKSNQPEFEEGGNFGAVYGPEDVGFIMPLDGSQPPGYAFLTEENQKYSGELPPSAAGSLPSLLFSYAGKVAAFNPAPNEHFRLFQYGFDLGAYKSSVTSEVASEGLFQYASYFNQTGAKEIAGGSNPPEINIGIAQEEKESSLKQIYPNVKFEYVRSERPVFKNETAGFYKSHDGSMGLLTMRLPSRRKVRMAFPLKDGYFNPRFEVEDHRFDVTILPYNEDGYDVEQNNLVLYLPRGLFFNGEKNGPVSFGDTLDKLAQSFEKKGEPIRGIHALLPESKYRFFDCETPAELVDFLIRDIYAYPDSEELPVKQNELKEALLKILANFDLESVQSFAKICDTLNSSRTPELIRANLAEIVRFITSRSEAKNLADNNTELASAINKLERKFNHKDSESFSRLYLHLLKSRGRENTRYEDESFEGRFVNGNVEVIQHILCLGKLGTYLFRGVVPKHVGHLPEFSIGLESEDRSEIRRRLRKIETFAENLEKQDPKLNEYVRLMETLDERYKSIDDDRKRLFKFMDQLELTGGLKLFLRQPRNAWERFWYAAKEKVLSFNAWLAQYPPFKQLERFFASRFNWKWPVSATALGILLLALIVAGIIAISSAVSKPATMDGESTTDTEDVSEGAPPGMSENAKQEILNNGELKAILESDLVKETLGGNSGVFLQEVHKYATALTKLNNYSAPGKAPVEGKKNPDLIYPGDKITLPTNGEVTVAEKETIWQISTGAYAKLLQEYVAVLNPDEDADESDAPSEEELEKLESSAITPGLKKILAAIKSKFS